MIHYLLQGAVYTVDETRDDFALPAESRRFDAYTHTLIPDADESPPMMTPKPSYAERVLQTYLAAHPCAPCH